MRPVTRSFCLWLAALASAGLCILWFSDSMTLGRAGTYLLPTLTLVFALGL